MRQINYDLYYAARRVLGYRQNWHVSYDIFRPLCCRQILLGSRLHVDNSDTVSHIDSAVKHHCSYWLSQTAHRCSNSSEPQTDLKDAHHTQTDSQRPQPLPCSYLLSPDVRTACIQVPPHSKHKTRLSLLLS